MGEGEERGQGQDGGARDEDGVHDASSEPVRADQGDEEVPDERGRHDGGGDVFPHASHDTPGPTASGVS